MSEWQKFRRTQLTELRPWKPDDDMSGISVSDIDRRMGSPQLGDMVARNPVHPSDRWIVRQDYFSENFAPDGERDLSAANQAEAVAACSDVTVSGNTDAWRLICKASSKSQGWMKSTKAMEISGVGCIVAWSTQQKSADGSYAVAEAGVFVPGVTIADDVNGGRKLVKA